MPSRAVDEAWHEFILEPTRLHRVLREGVGSYLHHTPDALQLESRITAIDGHHNRFATVQHAVPAHAHTKVHHNVSLRKSVRAVTGVDHTCTRQLTTQIEVRVPTG